MENFDRNVESVIKKQIKTVRQKKTVSVNKNSMKGHKSRLDLAGVKIGDRNTGQEKIFMLKHREKNAKKKTREMWPVKNV